ncbi:MAG: DUF5719 family protein [Dermatophilaceae bacterium]
MSWGSGVRALVTLLGAGGLTVAAVQIPGTVVLPEASGAAVAATPAQVPIRLAQLGCPGPETEGVPGVASVPGGTSTVLAATAPEQALDGVVVGSDEGTATLVGMPSGAALATGRQRGAVLTAGVTGPTAVEVSATGSLAPGLAALQTWVRRDGDDRGLDAAACAVPRAQAWLLAGGGDSTRRERLVVANPGANTLTVDVQVHGEKGPIPSVNGSRIAVPGHGRVGMLVDALAAGEKAPVVHVSATGGVMTALVEDSWIEAAVGRGRDDAGPADAPALEQIVPGAFVDGPARLRVVVPGDAEAVVQARALGPNGPTPLPDNGVVRVPGGAVRDLDLAGLPPGGYAVQVRADRPIVAAVLTERRSPGNGQSDLAWAASSAAIATLAGTPLPVGSKAGVQVVASGGPGSARVVTVAADGTVTSRVLDLAADTATLVDVTGAASVWVRHTSGTLRAAVSLELADGNGPLYAALSLNPAALSTTDVPVREIRR